MFPIRAPLLAFGAVPVDRSKKANMVEQMVEQFRVRDEFVLFLSPEGTRKRTDYWKSGFYKSRARQRSGWPVRTLTTRGSGLALVSRWR